MNDVPLNCPACRRPLDEFVCPHCDDGQDEEGNQCAECCGTNWLHIRQELGKDDGLWNPFGNDGMRHMENADVIGGATDETKGGQS